MIGFENETIQSIKNDMKQLAKLEMDITQICVVTPLPLTPLWDNIVNKYGIIDKDGHHYNAKHLVWDHPHISPDEMSNLLKWSFETVYPRRRPLQTINRFLYKYLTTDSISIGTKYIIQQFFHNNTFDFHPEKPHFISEINNKVKNNKSNIIKEQTHFDLAK